MPAVYLQDGTKINFPDGMSEADMTAAISSGPGQNVSRETYAPIPAPVMAPKEPRSGGILPFSEDESGKINYFDTDAGLLGVVKRAVMLPGQAMLGEFDPTSKEAIPRMLEGAAVMSPMSAAGRATGGMTGGGGYKVSAPKPPTREALKEATTEAYTKARNLGAEYEPSVIAKWADDMANTLNAEGRIAPNYPKVHRLLDAIKSPPEGASSISLESVDALYRELGRLGADPAEGGVASIVQKGLDDFHQTLSPSALVSGTATPAEAAALLKEGRGNAAAGFRSDRVTGLEKTAARRTAAANSGRNTDNAIRQRLTSLIESSKGSRGLSKEEEDAIDSIIFGTPTKNAARMVGNLLGGGGGLGSSFLAAGGAAGGAATMGPAGAILGLIPPAIGAAARTTANRMTQKELKMLDALIRSRSPLAASTSGPQRIYQPGAMQAIRENMIRALGPAMVEHPMNNNMQNALGAR